MGKYDRYWIWPLLISCLITVLAAGNNQDSDQSAGNPQKRLYWGSGLSYSQSYGDHITDVLVGSQILGYQFSNYLSGMIKGHFISMFHSEWLANGFGGSVGTHWTIFAYKRLSLYYDFSFGVLITDPEFPPHGTKVNFIPWGGAGSQFTLSKNQAIQIGFDHIHISNADMIRGSSHNPGFDSNGVVLYYLLYW